VCQYTVFCLSLKDEDCSAQLVPAREKVERMMRNRQPTKRIDLRAESDDDGSVTIASSFPRARRAPSRKNMMPSIMNTLNDVSLTSILYTVNNINLIIHTKGFVILYLLCTSVNHIFE
jgi:hypothetical protein